jgi:hypothetical protein
LKESENLPEPLQFIKAIHEQGVFQAKTLSSPKDLADIEYLQAIKKKQAK